MIAPPLYVNSVSIHTPAKGVTLTFLVFKLILLVSIHTPAKGVTARYAHA